MLTIMLTNCRKKLDIWNWFPKLQNIAPSKNHLVLKALGKHLWMNSYSMMVWCQMGNGHSGNDNLTYIIVKQQFKPTQFLDFFCHFHTFVFLILQCSVGRSNTGHGIQGSGAVCQLVEKPEARVQWTASRSIRIVNKIARLVDLIFGVKF